MKIRLADNNVKPNIVDRLYYTCMLKGRLNGQKCDIIAQHCASRFLLLCVTCFNFFS